jgi:hypothetical protein
MEKDKLIKVIVAAVIGLAAVVSPRHAVPRRRPPKPSKEALDAPPTPPSERGGGARTAPGG